MSNQKVLAGSYMIIKGMMEPGGKTKFKKKNTKPVEISSLLSSVKYKSTRLRAKKVVYLEQLKKLSILSSTFIHTVQHI